MVARLLSTISVELGIPLDQLDADSKSADFDGWDSLGHLNVILAVEAEFGVRFPPDDIPELTSVPALVDELVRRGV